MSAVITTVSDIRAVALVHPDAEAKLRAIHEEAFPPDERQYSMDYMLGRANQEDAVFRVVSVDGRVAGYLYLELSFDTRIAFLWYFAIERALRGRRIGSFAINDTITSLRKMHHYLAYILFEVHKPEIDQDGYQETVDRRRIDFYRRLGAYWVRGVDYRIPAADDPRRSLSYDPMFFALRGTFDEHEIRSGIIAMARDNYEGRWDDPRWRSLQESVEKATVIPPPLSVESVRDP